MKRMSSALDLWSAAPISRGGEDSGSDISSLRSSDRFDEDDEQRHGVQVGRETLRGWMAAAGLWKPRRKSGRPHPWRPRCGCRGELVQWTRA